MSDSYLRWVRRGAIAASVILVTGFAVGSLTGSKPDTAGVRRSAGEAATGPVAADQIGGGVASGAVESKISGLGTLQLPPAAANVIKTGDISLRVGRGRIDRAWSRVFDIAKANGGYVLSSSQGGGPRPIPLFEGDGGIAPQPYPLPDDGDGRFADITIRVPADRFEQVVAALTNGDLGRVTGRGISGQDVSQEFVDLESRLRHARSQEAVLLRLMAKANSIADTIAVQQQLSQVQLQIEELTGRLRYLKDQTQFATISVHLAESGAVVDGDGPSFSKAWSTAVEGLERMGTAALIGATWLSPFIVLALVWAATRRRRTRPAPPTETPA